MKCPICGKKDLTGHHLSYHIHEEHSPKDVGLTGEKQ